MYGGCCTGGNTIERGLHLKLTFKLIYYLQKIVLLSGRPYFGGYYLMTTKRVFSRWRIRYESVARRGCRLFSQGGKIRPLSAVLMSSSRCRREGS